MSGAESGDGARERDQRLAKLELLRELGVNPYAYRFERTHRIAEAVGSGDALCEEGSTVALAGRVMALRGHGHTSFGNIKDGSGSIQFYIKDAEVDQPTWEVFRLLDIGDIIGLRGVLFRTRTGELTVRTAGLELLGKSLRPLPEKYHGLQDKELRYRQRYVDLIVNDGVMDVFRTRSRIIDTIRRYLQEHGYPEVGIANVPQYLYVREGPRVVGLDTYTVADVHGGPVREPVAVGCYCEDESRCHRSILRELLQARGADVD